jgi:ribosomal protein S24E
MEIKIVKEKENPFFKRKDLVLDLVHRGQATPKIDDVKKELAERYKVDASQVVVEYIMTKSGLNESSAKVKILNERPPVVEEKKEEKKEEKQEAPAAEAVSAKAPAEAPAQKATPEPKQEEQKPAEKSEAPEEKKSNESEGSEAQTG